MGFFNSLKNVLINGDFVGRDKIVNMAEPTQLMLLQEEYKAEFKNNETCNEFIDELNHFNTKRTEIRDLEEKLTSAGYEGFIEIGIELKQLVSMLIVKNQHYKSAQKIIAYLLSDIHSIFIAKIKPQLKDKITDDQVLRLFHLHIESVINQKLGINALDIYNRQLQGMIYFLTGNCHLEWE
ncbi:hypothetical protein A8A01_25180 [Ewingella americana]|nr:hypothetical protein A8A01_25180 [Ewingella americana]